MSNPTTPIRAALVRERLIERLALNAGINPSSGFVAGIDERLNAAEEEPADRDSRLEYRMRFRERATSELAGLIDGSHLVAWQQSDKGNLVPAAPLWAGQAVFEGTTVIDRVDVDRDAFDRLIDTMHPLTELGEMATAAMSRSGDSHAPARHHGELWALHRSIAFLGTGDDRFSESWTGKIKSFYEEGKDGHLLAWAELAQALNHRSSAPSENNWTSIIDALRERLRAACERGVVDAAGISCADKRRHHIPVVDFVGAEIWHGKGTSIHLMVGDEGQPATWRDIRFAADDVRKLRETSSSANVAPTIQSPKAKPGRPRGSHFSAQDQNAFIKMRELVTAGMPVTTAAKAVERELISSDQPSRWDSWRSGYQRWLKSVDGNSE